MKLQQFLLYTLAAPADTLAYVSVNACAYATTSCLFGLHLIFVAHGPWPIVICVTSKASKHTNSPVDCHSANHLLYAVLIDFPLKCNVALLLQLEQSWRLKLRITTYWFRLTPECLACRCRWMATALGCMATNTKRVCVCVCADIYVLV